MRELRSTAPKRLPNASLAAGAPSSPEKSPASAGLPPACASSVGAASAGAGQTRGPGLPAGPAGPARRARPETFGTAPKARGGPDPIGAAASDDASGLTGMDAASSAATPPARKACAAAAQLRDDEAAPPYGPAPAGGGPRVPGDAIEDAVNAAPLPGDGPAFVDAMHARVNLFAVWRQLLTSTDLRVVQRAAERLLEIRFGKGPPPVEETETRVLWDIP